MNRQATKTQTHKERSTPPSAHGEPAVWLTGSALITCLALVVVTMFIIASNGLVTLWPRPIERITLRSGEILLGLPMGSEQFTPAEQDSQRIAELVAAGDLEQAGEDGTRTRLRFRLGNRDIGRDAFVWVPEYEIVSRDRPEDAVLVERDEWGIFIGVPEAVIVRTRSTESASSQFNPAGTLSTEFGTGPALREVVGESDGIRTVDSAVRIAQGPAETLETYSEIHGSFAKRRARIRALQKSEIPSVQDKLAAIDWRVRRAQMDTDIKPSRVTVPVWIGVAMSSVGLGAVGVGLLRRKHVTPLIAAVRTLCVLLAIAGAMFAVLERPIARGGVSTERLAEVVAQADAQRQDLRAQGDGLLAEIRTLEAADETVRLEIIDPGLSRFAPAEQSRPDTPMRLSQARRLIQSNTLGFSGRVRLYLTRWWDFLSRPPGESPGDGGVFPVIVGTVVLTLLLTVTVVPLGVVAAIYLREYASQGIVTSAIRIAINNLAGVPSIVYGMFGLGFFCYTLGGYVDAGPGEAAIGGMPWWTLIVTLILVFALAAALSAVGADRGPVKGGNGLWSKVARSVSLWAWLGCAGLAGYLIWTTPYFGGFFAEKLPQQPTFGTRGILWAALTLALLTLPVVIVATEEAISAVPGSMREGSLGCGASRWQTIRRIVLPAAMPGVLTGAILAMARGAGEVAPLMLVGAVNLAPTLPVSGDAPFLHGDRTFMHLGFHIYNLGFQSPDAEAARPLVWTTTLLLVAIVLGLNLFAMHIRSRLPSRGGGI